MVTYGSGERIGIAIIMDGKEAWRDNVFVERLWRTIKYEDVDLRAYASVCEARASLGSAGNPRAMESATIPPVVERRPSVVGCQQKPRRLLADGVDLVAGARFELTTFRL